MRIDDVLINALVARITSQRAEDIRVIGSDIYPRPVAIRGVVPDVTCRIGELALMFRTFNPELSYDPAMRQDVITLIQHAQDSGEYFLLATNPDDYNTGIGVVADLARVEVMPITVPVGFSPR